MRTDGGAVAQALSMIAGELTFKVAPCTVVIPHLSADSNPASSTHPDTISATVDAILAAGAETITIAAASPSPKSRADLHFDRLGYREEMWGRPVSFLDLAEDPLHESGVNEFLLEGCAPICLPRVLSTCDCRVSLAVASGSGRDVGGLGLSNLLSVLAASDRSLLDHLGPLSGRSVVSHFQSLLDHAAAKDAAPHWRDLISLARDLRPTLSIIDTFPRTKRSGPNRGRWAQPGMIIAGLDALAVDSVAAMLLGHDRTRNANLDLAESVGLGIANLDRIEIVGDRPLKVSRGLSSTFRMHWRSRSQKAVRSTVRPR